MKSGKYSTSVPVRNSEPEVIRPEFCDVDGCMTRYMGVGQPNRRGLADVIITTSSGHQVARCCYHYDRQLYATRKGRHSPIMGGAVDLTLDMVHAHWQRVDQEEAAAQAKRDAILEAERLREAA